jgi:glycosyltransferase involved in cell wall biosynthesis
MVGEGYLKENLVAQAPLGVRFFGKLTEEEKFDLLTRAHIIIVPGVREGWGLVVTEANATGTPAVAYDVAGLKDSVRNNVTGVLVPFGDIERLSEEIIILLENDGLRKNLASKALEWSRHFSWDHTAREFMNIIKSNLET